MILPREKRRRSFRGEGRSSPEFLLHVFSPSLPPPPPPDRREIFVLGERFKECPDGSESEGLSTEVRFVNWEHTKRARMGGGSEGKEEEEGR